MGGAGATFAFVALNCSSTAADEAAFSMVLLLVGVLVVVVGLFSTGTDSSIFSVTFFFGSLLSSVVVEELGCSLVDNDGGRFASTYFGVAAALLPTTLLGVELVVGGLWVVVVDDVLCVCEEAEESGGVGMVLLVKSASSPSSNRGELSFWVGAFFWGALWVVLSLPLCISCCVQTKHVAGKSHLMCF